MHRTALLHRFEDVDPYLRLSTLGFLAPDIQCAIPEWQQPTGLTFHLPDRDIPLDWKKAG